MPSVFLDSPTNSQLFTTCCMVAIGRDDPCCPVCGVEVEPKTYRARWEHAYGNQKAGRFGPLNLERK